MSSTNAQYDPTNLPAGIHLWTIDQAQSDRISKMLDFDFASLGIKGTYLENPQLKCQSCGKLSGLDDFVSGALKLGMHNTDFMIRALIEGAPNTAPAHKLKCCVCDTFYRECDFVNAQGAGWYDMAKGLISGVVSAFTGPAQPEKTASVRWADYWLMSNKAPSSASVRWADYWLMRDASKATSVRWADYWLMRDSAKSANVRWADYWLMRDDAGGKTANVRWADYWLMRDSKGAASVRWADYWLMKDATDKAANVRWADYWLMKDTEKAASVRWADYWLMREAVAAA